MTGYGAAAVNAAQSLIRSGNDPEWAWKRAVRCFAISAMKQS